MRDRSLDVVRRLETLKDRARAGDGRTLDALSETAGWLSTGAGILVNLFDPELLVLGGYFALLGPWLTEPLARSLPDRVLAPQDGGCRVEASALGFTAAARGGALEALTRIFDDPTAVASVRGAAIPPGATA